MTILDLKERLSLSLSLSLFHRRKEKEKEREIEKEEKEIQEEREYCRSSSSFSSSFRHVSFLHQMKRKNEEISSFDSLLTSITLSLSLSLLLSLSLSLRLLSLSFRLLSFPLSLSLTPLNDEERKKKEEEGGIRLRLNVRKGRKVSITMFLRFQSKFHSFFLFLFSLFFFLSPSKKSFFLSQKVSLPISSPFSCSSSSVKVLVVSLHSFFQSSLSSFLPFSRCSFSSFLTDTQREKKNERKMREKDGVISSNQNHSQVTYYTRRKRSKGRKLEGESSFFFLSLSQESEMGRKKKVKRKKERKKEEFENDEIRKWFLSRGRR